MGTVGAAADPTDKVTCDRSNPHYTLQCTLQTAHTMLAQKTLSIMYAAHYTLHTAHKTAVFEQMLQSGGWARSWVTADSGAMLSVSNQAWPTMTCQHLSVENFTHFSHMGRFLQEGILVDWYHILFKVEHSCAKIWLILAKCLEPEIECVEVKSIFIKRWRPGQFSISDTRTKTLVFDI